jgi:PTS system nitrogen regulatory IIA component
MAVSLTRLLKEKCVKLDLRQTDKKKVMAELVDFIAENTKLKDKKAFLSALLKREKLGSTGIGNGVAIPHAKLEKEKDFILAFARQEGGVDFGALDGEKTYLFFVIGSPAAEVGSHLKILAEISRVVKDKFIVEKLKKADNKKEIMGIISLYADQG